MTFVLKHDNAEALGNSEIFIEMKFRDFRLSGLGVMNI